MIAINIGCEIIHEPQATSLRPVPPEIRETLSASSLLHAKCSNTCLTGADASVGTDHTYSYDLAGNRTDGNRSYNAANQVIGWNYDAAGNLTNDGTRSYAYDALSRLTQQGATAYQYNGDGTLVSRTAGGTTTRYAQDLAAPLTQVLNDGSADYLYGLSRLAAQTGVSRTWYATDALGSVRQTLSDSGAVLTAAQYDPWGSLEAGASAPFGFTGELSDGGLTYLRARWYDGGRGSFVSVDPFDGIPEEPLSQHPYQYANRNPLTNVDPHRLGGYYGRNEVACAHG